MDSLGVCPCTFGMSVCVIIVLLSKINDHMACSLDIISGTVFMSTVPSLYIHRVDIQYMKDYRRIRPSTLSNSLKFQHPSSIQVHTCLVVQLRSTRLRHQPIISERRCRVGLGHRAALDSTKLSPPAGGRNGVVQLVVTVIAVTSCIARRAAREPIHHEHH